MLGLADIDGVLRGKFVSLEKLNSLLNKGGGFCDCVFGWDVGDHLPDRGRPALGRRVRCVPEFLAMPVPTETI